MSDQIRRATEAVARIIDDVPLIDAAPSHIRAIRAERIVRIVMDAMREPADGAPGSEGPAGRLADLFEVRNFAWRGTPR